VLFLLKGFIIETTDSLLAGQWLNLFLKNSKLQEGTFNFSQNSNYARPLCFTVYLLLFNKMVCYKQQKMAFSSMKQNPDKRSTPRTSTCPSSAPPFIKKTVHSSLNEGDFTTWLNKKSASASLQ